MSTRGPKPKPSHLKLAAGNPGKRPINANEPKPPELDRPPTCPKYLGKVAAAEWKRVVRDLWKMKCLAGIDVAILAGYCDAFETWILAKRQIEAWRAEEKAFERLQVQHLVAAAEAKAAGQDPPAPPKRPEGAFDGLLAYTTNGNLVQNPLLGIANKARADVLRFAAELGMTPSARTRLDVKPLSEEPANSSRFFGRAG